MIAMVSLLEEIPFLFGNSYKPNPERFKPLSDAKFNLGKPYFLKIKKGL